LWSGYKIGQVEEISFIPQYSREGNMQSPMESGASIQYQMDIEFQLSKAKVLPEEYYITQVNKTFKLTSSVISGAESQDYVEKQKTDKTWTSVKFANLNSRSKKESTCGLLLLKSRSLLGLKL
jgi:hypothetical protein